MKLSARNQFKGIITHISEGAVKKQSRMFRSVIKLDKNFHVYVHGNSKFIEKGFDDEANMQYYRLFFREEE